MGKECMARLSRRLWGGMSLKTAAKEANPDYEKLFIVHTDACKDGLGQFYISDTKEKLESSHMHHVLSQQLKKTTISMREN